MTKNKPLKRIITFCLALIIALGIPITAFAEQDWYGVSDPLTYTTTVKIGNHTYAAGSHSYVMRLDESNRIAYCIQPDIMIGADESDWLYESGSTSPGWEALSSLQRQAINLLLLYGYPNQTLPGTKSEQYFATRMMIWEIIMGYRNENKPFNRTDSRCYDAFSGHSGFVKAYNELQSRLVSHYVRPSFAGASRSQAPTIALNYNPSTKQYETSVTDTNNVLSSFNFSMSGVTFTRNGNTLKISTAKEITTETAVSSTKPLPAPISSGILVWRSVNDPGNQELITGGGAGDPVPAYFKLKTNPALGSLKIVKSFELATKPIENVEFLITGPHGYSKTFKTNSAGEITVNNLPIGTYTVTEQSCEANQGYILAESQNITVEMDKTTTANIQNHIMRGNLKIIKGFELATKPIENVEFLITGPHGYNKTFKTNSAGEITVNNLPIGTYTVTEQSCEANQGYILAESQNITVEMDKTTIVNIQNNIMRGDLKVIKTFEGRETPLAGVEFTITGPHDYNQTFATDENGEINITDLPIGEYTVTEIESELTEGYVLSEPQTVTVAHDALAELAIHNDYQRGDLKVIKTFEGRETPLAGVEFTITGPHDYNQTFATDENGEINITDLPIGEYTVTEIESELTEGYVLSEPQTVTVAYQQLKELEIDNRKIRGSIEISKEDVSTGEKLPDTGIRILDKDKNILFEGRTDKNGIVKFENLEYGSYYYQEFDAPKGYVIDESLFPFEVTGDGEIIKATMHNRMISSEIIIHKVSSTDGSSLYQAGIRFKDAQGNVIAEGYTDENGIFSTILTYGEYTYEEFQAPDGFILDPTPHKIIITEDGKVIKETLRNDEKVELVATGDTSDSIIWGIIAALSAIGILCYFVLRIRKKQKAEK